MKSVVHELPDKRVVVVVVLRTIITLLVLLATTAACLLLQLSCVSLGTLIKKIKKNDISDVLCYIWTTKI